MKYQKVVIKESGGLENVVMNGLCQLMHESGAAVVLIVPGKKS